MTNLKAKFSILLFCSSVSTLAFADQDWESPSSEKAPENCQKILIHEPKSTNLQISNPPPLNYPVVPDLRDSDQLSNYARVLRRKLGESSYNTATAFNEVSGDSDEKFEAIKVSLSRSEDGNARALMDMFGEFNDIATRIAPPEKFSTETAVREAKSGARMFLQKITSLARGSGVPIPPTVQQWLDLYNQESPKFLYLREQVAAAVRDTEKRSEAAELAMENIKNLIQVKLQERDQLLSMAEEVKSQLVGLSITEQEDINHGVLIPLLKEIDSIQEFVTAHQMILAQKRITFEMSRDVVDEMIRTVHIAVPTLKNAAISADDAMHFSNMAEATQRLRDVVQKTIVSTSKTIEGTAAKTAQLQNSQVLSAASMNLSLSHLIRAVNTTRESSDKALPRLMALTAQWNTTNEQIRRIIQQIPQPLQLQDKANEESETENKSGNEIELGSKN